MLIKVIEVEFMIPLIMCVCLFNERHIIITSLIMVNQKSQDIHSHKARVVYKIVKNEQVDGQHS